MKMSNTVRLALWYQEKQKSGLSMDKVNVNYDVVSFLNKNGSTKFSEMKKGQQKAEIERLAGKLLKRVRKMD